MSWLKSLLPSFNYTDQHLVQTFHVCDLPVAFMILYIILLYGYITILPALGIIQLSPYLFILLMKLFNYSSDASNWLIQWL